MSSSGPSKSSFGPLTSISGLGRLTSTSGPSILGPFNPNDGIFILGILNPPPVPSRSISGPSISPFGTLISPLIFGTDTSTSPFSLGPLRLKSTSGIEILGPDMAGILNFGPLILPSGPSMSSSGPSISSFGPLTSISGLGRLTSTSGPSILGPFIPNDGMWILGILNPPAVPSRSISGPSISPFGTLISPSIFGTETSTSPFSLGPLRLKSTSGIEILGPDMDGILNFGLLILP
ncbi:hypothetical protein ANANG_G00060150 [Anguilla anguilla]|uniref:Uncharacterized protein n=1 Tax=Anguilla anguilla TaxID=7936 RepID=A0A9D3S1W1_ANGAN|nr:hypothetical protein ANANG_G00060150 [Anguilla anguilla]